MRIERRRDGAVEELELRPEVLVDGTGVLRARVRARAATGATLRLDGPSGAHAVALPAGDDGVFAGELRVPGVARWWPHTHGEPVLHDVRVDVGGAWGTRCAAARRVGFRTLAAGPRPGHAVEADGLSLHVNGVAVFARGAVWTPADPVGLAPAPGELRRVLVAARDAGLNLLRVPGIGVYESPAFHDLCDELGLLVWQDLMFANLDFPFADADFAALVEREVAAQLAAVAGRPSLAVVCGNSEVEQQAAMFGLDPAVGRGELFGERVGALLESSGADAVWVASAPSGGALPFRPDRGVANWFGVGAYLRPLEETRRAGVRFASECLAFANVPDEDAAGAGAVVHEPRWKAGVPRDAGAGWDFEDVRDHYLRALFGVDPVALRRVDHERYLELSRAVTGEVMAAVFGEWRRAGSPCGGGLVLWLRDLAPGAGWGVLDHRGLPKAAFHHLRRALAPTAVWLVDEGLGGVVAHVAHDGPAPLRARLRVALYRDLEHRVEEASVAVQLPGHGACEHDLEGPELLGRFVDAAWAYRFGPPGHDAVVATLSDGERGEQLGQAFLFPAGRPLERVPAERLGLSAQASPAAGADAGGAVVLTVSATRLAYGVRVHAPGWDADDDAFSVEPGGSRRVVLRPREPGAAFPAAALSALNLSGRARIAPAEPRAVAAA